MKSRNQQEFLLSFFNDQQRKVPRDFYEERYERGFWLVKQWNGDNQKWQVAVFTEESFNNYKKAGELNQNKLL